MSETKVRHTSWNDNFSQENSTRGPDAYTVSTATVYIPISVAFDSIWKQAICHSKQSSIRKERLAVSRNHVEGITEDHISVDANASRVVAYMDEGLVGSFVPSP